MDKIIQTLKLDLKKNKIITMFLKKGILLIIQSNVISTTQSHSGKLINVNGKDYWIWVATVGEPVVIDVSSCNSNYIFQTRDIKSNSCR